MFAVTHLTRLLQRRWNPAQHCFASLVAFVLFAIAIAPLSAQSPKPTTRPNILWFVVDDMSANFSCYGEKTIQTPHVDRLAAEGTKFSNAFVTAPVCSPCRSAMITGMYQTTIGSHHHRGGRGKLKIHLPANVKPLPALFQQAGYFTCIGSGLLQSNRGGRANRPSAQSGLGKTDYNFEWDPAIYDAADWSGRKPDQPFFMQVQLSGGKLRGDSLQSYSKLAQRATSELGSTVQPDAVQLPPYYPRDPVILADWAAYLDAVRLTDDHVGKVIKRLESEGLMDSTLVIFMTDHGISHARGKQFLYDEGTHVPFVVRGPGIAQGNLREDLIEHIDIAAISLAAAGIEIPRSMQARNVFAAGYKPRDAVFAARDRCDETVERLRSVRTDQYLYIRNFYPERPHLQPNAYKDGKAIIKTLRSLHAAGKLDQLAESLLFSQKRAAEELYQWRTDSWQITNLAADPSHQAALTEHRQRLERWMDETQDKGPETEEMYDSDMAVYLGKGNPVVEKNIAIMKQWAQQGL